jgi:hypothetical protein
VSSEAFGQYGNALRAVSFYTAEGWSQDVSRGYRQLDRAHDADETLTEGRSDLANWRVRRLARGQSQPPGCSFAIGSIADVSLPGLRRSP